MDDRIIYGLDNNFNYSIFKNNSLLYIILDALEVITEQLMNKE